MAGSDQLQVMRAKPNRNGPGQGQPLIELQGSQEEIESKHADKKDCNGVTRKEQFEGMKQPLEHVPCWCTLDLIGGHTAERRIGPGRIFPGLFLELIHLGRHIFRLYDIVLEQGFTFKNRAHESQCQNCHDGDHEELGQDTTQ